jgi:hypothetical protein
MRSAAAGTIVMGLAFFDGVFVGAPTVLLGAVALAVPYVALSSLVGLIVSGTLVAGL